MAYDETTAAAIRDADALRAENERLRVNVREWLLSAFADGGIDEDPDEHDHPKWYKINASARALRKLCEIAGIKVSYTETEIDAIARAVECCDGDGWKTVVCHESGRSGRVPIPDCHHPGSGYNDHERAIKARALAGMPPASDARTRALEEVWDMIDGGKEVVRPEGHTEVVDWTPSELQDAIRALIKPAGGEPNVCGIPIVAGDGFPPDTGALVQDGKVVAVIKTKPAGGE